MIVFTSQVCLVMEYAEGGSLYNGKSLLNCLLVHLQWRRVFNSGSTTIYIFHFPFTPFLIYYLHSRIHHNKNLPTT